MRVKELKNVLANLPDDAEVVVRAQMHRIVKGGRVDYIPISSFNPVINAEYRRLILNPESHLRGMAWVPEREENVYCVDCTNYGKLEVCKKKNRDCSTCESPCKCKNCQPYNCDSAVPFSDRPKYEKRG